MTHHVLEIHAVFQRDIHLLKLDAARAYNAVLNKSMGHVTNSASGAQIKVDFEVTLPKYCDLIRIVSYLVSGLSTNYVSNSKTWAKTQP